MNGDDRIRTPGEGELRMGGDSLDIVSTRK